MITVVKNLLLWVSFHGERFSIKLYASFTKNKGMALKVKETGESLWSRW